MGDVPEKFRKTLDDLLEAVEAEFGERLVTLAVFGSVARGTATAESDLDVLIVADGLPDGRMNRLAAIDRVEETLVGLDAAHARLRISPVIKTPVEAARGSPLYWDMTEHVLILRDKDGFLARTLGGVRARLAALGARKVVRGNAWYWVLKKDFSPGEIFEI